MVNPLKKTPPLVERKPERAKVTREEFIENIKKADEWRKKRLAELTGRLNMQREYETTSD